jgi:hypothetical protein
MCACSLVGDPGVLEDAQAFVVGVDRTRHPIELRLALQHDHRQAAAASRWAIVRPVGPSPTMQTSQSYAVAAPLAAESLGDRGR